MADPTAETIAELQAELDATRDERDRYRQIIEDDIRERRAAAALFRSLAEPRDVVDDERPL